LRLQRHGDRWSASRDHNAVVWRVRRPAQCAIAVMHVYIVVPELTQAAAGQAVECRKPLHGIHLLDDAVQDCGGIARTRADLSDPVGGG
jgi:hypothetical protein